MSPPKSLSSIQAEIDALDPNYKALKIVGSGSYGLVIRAQDLKTNSLVAIKRVNAEIFDDPMLSNRILREIKLLEFFRDDNIVGLRTLLTPKTADFDVFFIVMDLMESDLKQIIKSKQGLSDEHIQFFVYQMLRGLNIIHKAGVYHRDVTPANILVNTNCDLKICDFGLSKGEDEDSGEMTDYVTMRWYRAPELVMEEKHYTGAIDIWGVGLIFAELLGSSPLCQGKDRVNQLDKIIDVVGKPSESDIASFGSDAAKKYLNRKTDRPPLDLNEKFPTANPLAIDLLSKMLVFHPKNRILVGEAMRHSYFSELYDVQDDFEIASFEFSDSKDKTTQEIKSIIHEEAIKIKQKRTPGMLANLIKK